MTDAAELSFAMTLRDEATRAAKSAKRVLSSLGGKTRPIETDVKVDASGVAAATRDAKADLTKFAKDARDVGEAAGVGFGKGLSDGISSVKGKVAASAAAVGAAAGGAVGASIVGAVNVDAVNDRLAASLGATPAEARKYGKIAGDLYAGAWGDSAEQVATALGAVKTSFRQLSGSGELKQATTEALDFATAFEVDVVRATQVAGTVLKSGLADSATEAFDLLTAASQRVPSQLRDDVLDAAEEYSQFFAQLGIEGPQAFAMIAAGAKDGQYGIDKVGDAVKEFTIRATDMSTASQDAYKSVGLDAREMSNEILAGGDRASTATQKIVRGLLKIKDPAKRANASIALFGTPLEDLSVGQIPKFLRSLQTSRNKLGDWRGSIRDAGQTLNDNAKTNLTAFKRGVERAFVDTVGGKVLPVVSDWASSLSTNLGPALSGIVDVGRDVIGFLSEHKTTAQILVGTIAALVAITAAHNAATTIAAAGGLAKWAVGLLRASSIGKAYTAVTWAMNTALLSSPITWLVIGIVALVAALVLAWRKSETFRSVVLGTWDAIKGATLAAVNAVRGWISSAWSWISKTSAKVWNGITSTVSAAVRGVSSVVRAVVGGVLAYWRFVWNAVKAVAGAVWKGITTVVSTYINTVRTVISTGVGLVRSVWSTGWSKIREAVSTTLSKVVGFVKDLPGRILSGLGNLGSLLWDAGTDVVQGMIDGILSMGSRLASSVSNFIDQHVPGPVKKLLGIASPSKLFKKFGRQTIIGYALGIRGEAGTVSKALDRVFGLVEKFNRRRFSSDKAASEATSATMRRLAAETKAIRENAAARDRVVAKIRDAIKYGREFTASLIESAKVSAISVANDAPVTAGFIAQGLKSRLSAIRTFTANLAKLRKAGAAKSIIRDLESQGVDAGGAYAAALAAARPDQIAEINQTQAEIVKASERAGAQAATSLTKGLLRQRRELDRTAKILARVFSDALRAELGGRSGAGDRAGRALVDSLRRTDATELSRAAREQSARTLTRATEIVTIRHEITSPDGSLDELTAQEIADLIARDPKSAKVLETALSSQRRRRNANTITASD